MDKEKQIKEMMKDIYRLSKMPPPMIEGLGEWSDTISEYLINVGYRKITENEVVISKKEYERLINQNKGLKEEHIYKSVLSPEILFYNIKYHLKSQHNLDDPEILKTIHTVISNSFIKSKPEDKDGNAD